MDTFFLQIDRYHPYEARSLLLNIRRDRMVLVWNFGFESSKSDENMTLALCTVVVTILGSKKSKISHNSGL